MRVIAGQFRSRKLVAPPGDSTRPTPDRLREALFSILQLAIENAVFYDLYAGSGSVGIEALSRGAARAVFIESDRHALSALRSNLQSLGLDRRALVVPKRVKLAVKDGLSGLVFADPPYVNPAEYEALYAALQTQTANVDRLLIQHDRRLTPPPAIGLLSRHRELKQGDNVVSFYGRVAGNPAP